MIGVLVAATSAGVTTFLAVRVVVVLCTTVAVREAVARSFAGVVREAVVAAVSALRADALAADLLDDVLAVAETGVADSSLAELEIVVVLALVVVAAEDAEAAFELSFTVELVFAFVSVWDVLDELSAVETSRAALSFVVEVRLESVAEALVVSVELDWALIELVSFELEAASALSFVLDELADESTDELDEAELAELADVAELVVDEPSFAGTVPSPVGVFDCCLVSELVLILSA